MWWPKCVELDGEPRLDENFLQLNSIAAGKDIRHSYFTASTASIGRRRPGHVDFPVDGRGVVFSGATREPMVTGLTRPHSARLQENRLWVANSGYGELGAVESGTFHAHAKLDGWTRGLAFDREIAFIGTSRVLPRFRAYAPGVDAALAACGVHAVDTRSGSVMASLIWPSGNQIFAIEILPSTARLPFRLRRRAAQERNLFFTFQDR
jgi:uncharacterized protein (TIGR03032 family)